MPDPEVTIGDDGTTRLRAALDNKRDALEIIGAILAQKSRDAFFNQALGEITWPERYPNQSAPKVNIAGVLEDLNKGSTIKGRRFDARPALKGVSNPGLSGSIDHQVIGPDTVQVGPTIEYAGLMQLGGKSVQPVTPTAKAALRKWIAKRGKAGKKDRAKARTPGTNPLARDVAKPDPIAKRLRFLLDVDQLETEVNPRPFLGIDDEDKRDIRRVVAEQVAKQAEAAGGGHGNG